MSGLRRVIIAHSHPAFTRGGGEVAAHRVFEYLRARGDDVIFLGLAIDPAKTGRFFAPGQRLMHLGPGDFALGGPGMDSFEMEHSDPEVESWLVEFLADLDADIYHVHHLWNIGAGVIRGLAQARPMAQRVLTLHDFGALCANHGQMLRPDRTLCRQASLVDCAACVPDRAPLDHVVRRMRMRETLDHFDRLISPSCFLRDRMERWGVPKGRIEVLENGLASPPGVPRDTLETLETLDEKSVRFGFFGNANRTKGLDVLLRAAELLHRKGPSRDTSITVHGVSAAEVAQTWPEGAIPPNVLFRGRYAPEQAIPLMREMGWVVMPSIWWENAPVVIQEARAAGVPVLASNIGGMAEKVAGFGCLFPVGDPVALAAAMAELSGNPQRLLEHRRNITPPLSLAAHVAELEAGDPGRGQGEDAGREDRASGLKLGGTSA